MTGAAGPSSHVDTAPARFLTLVPRGLQWILQDELHEMTEYVVRVVGEPQQDRSIDRRTSSRDAPPIDREQRLLRRLQEEWTNAQRRALQRQRLQRQRDHGSSKDPQTAMNSASESAALRPTGTVPLPRSLCEGSDPTHRPDGHTNPKDNHNSNRTRTYGIGYYTHSSAGAPIMPDEETRSTSVVQDAWSMPGEMPGLVWMQVETPPCESSWRTLLQEPCVGSLLVLAGLWDDLAIPLAAHSLATATSQLRHLLSTPNYALQLAYDTWKTCVSDYWKEFLSHTDMVRLLRRLSGRQEPLRFRISLLRDESKHYSYSRAELVQAIASFLVPDHVCRRNVPWSVDLKQFDLELVVLLRETSLAVGLSVRPNQWVGAKTFAQGRLPPQVHPPPQQYLVRNMAGVTRLRGTTARLLLRLAQLQVGDVLLDPCAGVGTIPLESRGAMALGGDLQLSAEDPIAGLANQYRRYSLQLQQQQQQAPWGHSNTPLSRSQRNNYADLMAWDACCLPIRSSSVDAIVSDLPFGQQCLSTNQLHGLLPLLVQEMARVLRPITGRMVLLCGNHGTILDELIRSNAKHDSCVWQLPCASVFPVNLGGLMAWCLVVRRGHGMVEAGCMAENDRDRVRRLVRRRNWIRRLERSRNERAQG